MTFVKSTPRRRGVTLLEMLVVVALVVLMMVILVQIFQAATGAISVSRTYQELSNNLRMLDQTIRSDLSGVTSPMTPPLDPGLKLGYFEYGENSPADLQGEDLDDYIAFTTKAPEGQSFTGRVWIPIQTADQATAAQIQPVVVTSQFAEVIYFVRNGNLYRRVLLVAPDRRSSLSNGTVPGGVAGAYFPGYLFNLPAMNVSWQGVNDISCRPTNNASFAASQSPPTPNDLGDLTDRHNRAFRPRFMNDYFDTTVGSPNVGTYKPDGISDDNNGDDVPDYYPTLYPNLLANGAGVLLNEQSPYPMGAGRALSNPYDVLAFPFINPAMYSKPDVESISTANGTRTNSQLGWIHSPDPSGRSLNHGPLLDGDSLYFPSAPIPATQRSTWFGFPLWQETMTGARGGLLGWTDPVQRVNQTGAQPWGLRPFPPTSTPASTSLNFPPPAQAPFALNTLYANDGAGSLNFVPALASNLPSLSPASNPLQGVVWDDDLIMTGVKSFDVKAYDADAPLYNRPSSATVYSSGYQDLGYAGDRDAFGSHYLAAGYPISLMTMDTPSRGSIPALPFFPLQDSNFNPIGFGHEGRIPPLTADNRVNPSRPYRNAVLPSFTNLAEPNNVGDDTLTGSNAPIRLRRVWDTWSTTYTRAPESDLNFNGTSFQPYPNDLPVYPSYPAPYPSPLRGIQIQIRVVDPRDERIKILTLRHDFSDKL